MCALFSSGLEFLTLRITHDLKARTAQSLMISESQRSAFFEAAREKAGLRAPKEWRTAPSRLTLKEQLRFIDAVYTRDGQAGPMVQNLLETGTRVEDAE